MGSHFGSKKVAKFSRTFIPTIRWGYVLNSETSPSVNIVVTLIRQQRSSSLLFPLAVPLFEQRPETIPQVKGAVFASSLAFVKRSPENP